MDQEFIEVKNTITEFIININSRIDDININYNTGGSFNNDRIVNLLDDLQALSEGINVIREFYGNIDLSELIEKLGMLEKALEDKDNQLLSDILKFELKDLLEYWKTCLSE